MEFFSHIYTFHFFMRSFTKRVYNFFHKKCDDRASRDEPAYKRAGGGASL